MQALEKRVAALEQASAPGDRIEAIVRIIVTPGQPRREIQRLRTTDGQHWERMPGESDDDLIDRAKMEATYSELMPLFIANE